MFGGQVLNVRAGLKWSPKLGVYNNPTAFFLCFRCSICHLKPCNATQKQGYFLSLYKQEVYLPITLGIVLLV